MAPKALVIFTGADGQVLKDTIQEGTRPFDLTDLSVNFNMRYADNANIKLSKSANIVDAENGEVEYLWADDDLDEPGEYYAWWTVVLEDDTTVDTDEFLVVVTEHAPGVRTRTGAIYKKARSIIPVTWNALEDYSEYGDELLQGRIEAAKIRIIGHEVPVEDEETYDIRVQEFIAKVAALAIIPAGIDYWMNQKQSATATGTNEVISYPDRIRGLEKIQERLLAEIANDRAEIEELIDNPDLRPSTGVPKFSPGTDNGYITPLPSKHFFDYAFQHDSIWKRKTRGNW